ncbi:MAG: hypothetical protein EOP04_15925 [Proteobacteria bacterium]|nr:MAG: hypothetical protein EOP04_15925 [Pseudomonadota bacterium]
MLPDEVPLPCRKVEIIKEIIESDIESYLEKSDSRSPDMAACLSDLGGPVECSSIPSESYEDEICRNNLIIARARLIDWIWAHKPVEELDEAVVINKMIARIYNGDKSMDEFGTEMFNLSDRFVKINKDNTEAHNLRSYFSIQAIKLKFDPSILKKGKVSADFLAHSPNSDSSKAGLLYSSAYSLIEYVSSQNITDLEQAEVHAKDYIATYPDLPAGYHMMAMIEGYRGNLSLCKEWTQKGLKAGGSGQVGYNDYREIVKSIENGTFRKESLGIRIDPSEAFNPEKILQ